jgi:hypothetical protein
MYGSSYGNFARPARKFRTPKPIGSSKKTIANKVIEFLLSIGYTEVPARTGKYRQFENTNPELNRIPVTDSDGKKYYLFVGRSGAVRKGHSASNSFSITDSTHKRMQTLGIF